MVLPAESEMSIDLEKRPDGVAVVLLNRPHVLNALDVPAKEALGAIWQELAADEAVRAIILAGAGPRAFCAGSDIKEMHRTGTMVTTDTLIMALPGVGVALNKPVIAALHGHTLGMGLSLALHCDLRIAQTGTDLAFPEVQHGMISGVSTLRLPDLVGPGKAMEYLLLGQRIPLDEALAAGLLNRVVEDARALAEEWAVAIARAPAAAVQATRRLASFRRNLTAAERAEIDAVRRAVEAAAHFKANAAAFHH
jgi:enoyl-CoA hydratase/carnithine racemase